MITREQFVSDLRDKHPDIFTSDTPDEYIYQTGRMAFPDSDVEEWTEIKRKPKVDTSPEGWNELVLKDINDDSWEWVKHAYANSLQGTLEQWKNGELDYDIKKDYDQLNVGEKILAGVGSFLMPLDLVTLFGGSLATKGILALGTKVAGKKLSQSLAGRGFLTRLDAVGVKHGLGEGVAKGAIERAIVEGNTLGLYEGAKAGLHADYTGGDVTRAIADNYVHGAILGGAMGGIGGTLEGNFLKYKMLKDIRTTGGFRNLGEKGGFAKHYTSSQIEKMMKYTGIVPQYAAEVGVLETSSLIEAAKNGELKGEKLLEDLVVNIGFAGLMRGKRKITGELVKQFKRGKNQYTEDFDLTLKSELRKRLYKDERPWEERLADRAEDGLKDLKETAKRDGNKDLEEVTDEGIADFNDSRSTPKFKTNEELKKLIKYNELETRIAVHEELLKEDWNRATAEKRVEALLSTDNHINELFATLDDFISNKKVTEIEGTDARAWLSQKANELKRVNDKAIHKTTLSEDTFADNVNVAKGLRTQELVELGKVNKKSPWTESQFEELIQTERGVGSYISGTREALKILRGKEGAEGRDITFTQDKYDEAKLKLKDIESGKDVETAGSLIAASVLKGKNLKGVEELSKIAFQDYTQSEDSKALIQYAPYVAKFLNHVSKSGRKIDEISLVEVQQYIRKRRIERKGKPLGSTELSAISRFTKHIGTEKGKFNKKIEWTPLIDSIFKATNKKLQAGTEPSVPGVREEVVEIGKKLSVDKNDAGYSLTADLMSKFGIRDQEIPYIKKDIIKETTVNGKKKYYMDMEAREFEVDPASGRELVSIGVGKPHTPRSYVYIPNQLAKKLIKYLDTNEFKKKHYSEVGRRITKSNNPTKKQRDLRSRIESYALQNAPDLLPQLLYVLRHDVGRIGEIYKKMNPEQAIEMQIKMHEKLGTKFGTPRKKIVGEKQGVSVEEKPELPTPPQEPQRAVIDEIIESKKIHERIKTKKDVLEEYQPQNQKAIIAQKDMIIDALRGAQKPKVQAIVSHKRFIRSHVRAIQDIKANPEKKFPKMFGDIPWHEAQISNYKNALGLLKKVAPEGRVEHGAFRISEGKGERNYLKKLIVAEEDYHGISRKKLGNESYEREIRDLTKNSLGLEDPVSSITKLSTDELYDFLNLLRSTDYSKAGSKFKASEATVIKMAKERGVEHLLEEMLSNLGVKDGKFENVESKSILDNIRGVLAEHYERTNFEPSASDNMVTWLSKPFVKFPSVGRRIITPVYALLKNPKIGGDFGSKIADSFLNWDVTNTLIRGYTSQRYLEIRALVGKDARMLQFADEEKVKKWKKDMTPEELEFVKQMKIKGTNEYKALQIWDGMRKNLYNRLKEYTQKWTNKSIEADLNKWMERQYVEDYFTRRLSKEFLEILPEIESQPFWGKIFNENMDSYVRGKVNAMKAREGESPLDFTNRKKAKAESIRNDKSEGGAIDIVKERVQTFLDMPNHRVINKNLMTRGILLDRQVEIEVKGKRKIINTYDESFRESGEHYGYSMGKYLSTLRHFPEITELGKELKLGNWKKNIFDILTSTEERKKHKINQDWGDYLKLVLEAHLGLQSSTTDRIAKKNLRWMSALSSTGAAAGLSTPFVHGLKNLGLGFINSTRHFGMRNTFAGFIKYMDIQERQKMREQGVGEYFSTNILRTQKNIIEEMGLTEKIPVVGKLFTMDNIFKMNFMSKSEEIGRISAAFAGGLYFHQMLNAYKGQKNSFWMGKGVNKRAEFAFKNQFKLSKEEIDFIKNTKYEDLFKEGDNFNKMAWIQNKVEHFSHVSSQGGTSTILLPLWMSQPGWKPLTLFARIATSATHDLWQNTFRPLWEHGNPMPLVRHAAASTFTGAGLYYFYKYIMGQDQMFEKSDAKWKTLAQMLWRAEFLGLWTQLINPHSSPIYSKGKTGSVGVDPTFVNDFFEPYMIRSARAITEGLATVMTDPTNPKGWSQATKYVAKNTVSGYGQISRQWDRLIYPELHEWRGFRTAARSFKKDKGYEIPIVTMQTARSIYYKDLKDNFWKGSERDFAKSYYNTLAYLDSDMAESGYVNPVYRRKKAMQRIEHSLKTMNPVNFSDESKGRVMSKKREFLNYLKNNNPEEYKRALKAEREFNFKYRKLLAAVQKSKYKLDYSIYYDRY